MKVLMLSIDKNIFDTASNVSKRMIEYGSLVDELHIVVYTKTGFTPIKLANNIFVYPTNTKIRFAYFFQAYVICARILKKRKGTIVTSQEAMTNLLGVFLKFMFFVPLQVQIHTDFKNPEFWRESIKNKLRYIGYEIGIKYANGVRVVSNRIKNSISASKVDVLPIFREVRKADTLGSGIDLHKKYSQFDNIILMVSRLEREKNILLALNVFKKILMKFPKVGLIIAGGGSELEYLRGVAGKLNVDNSVIFLGDVLAVESLYKTSDIFLHTANYEGYGIVFIETALSGCPIVSTDVGIVSEYFENEKSALVCKVGDSNCLSSSVIKLIENKEFRERLSRKAMSDIREQVSKNTKEQHLKEYKRLWEMCAKQ